MRTSSLNVWRIDLCKVCANELSKLRMAISSTTSAKSLCVHTRRFRDRCLRIFTCFGSFGIVDRDYLEQGQIDSFKRDGVFVPDVAEIENLLLVPELIEAVAIQLMVDPKKVLDDVKRFVMEDFQRGLQRHALETTQ